MSIVFVYPCVWECMCLSVWANTCVSVTVRVFWGMAQRLTGQKSASYIIPLNQASKIFLVAWYRLFYFSDSTSRSSSIKVYVTWFAKVSIIRPPLYYQWMNGYWSNEFLWQNAKKKKWRRYSSIEELVNFAIKGVGGDTRENNESLWHRNVVVQLTRKQFRVKDFQKLKLKNRKKNDCTNSLW